MPTDGTSSSTLTVTLADAQGNLIPGATVVLSATGSGNALVQPSAVTNASGVTTGTLASTVPGPKTITAIANPGPGQVVLAQRPIVTFLPGPPDPITSTIVASPSTVLANGVATSLLTITVRDGAGNPLAGRTVQLAATGAANALLQPAAPTNASGVTTGRLASTRAEQKAVTATVSPGPGQVVLAQPALVTFTPGPPADATSTFTANPTSLVADGVATSTLTVTVRDVNGNAVPGQTVRFAATGSGNTLVQPAAVTDATGAATGTLASTRVGAKTVIATINPGPGQVVLTQQATVTFLPGAPNGVTSTVTVSPATVIADGVAFSTITVTVRDATGNPVPGAAVQLGATGSANAIVQPFTVTDASGVATGSIASTRAELKSVIATVNPGPAQVVIAQQPQVLFIAGPPSPATSTLVANPTSVVADGASTAAIIATVRDAQGNPVPGQTVRLTATGSNNTLAQPPATTDASGVAIGTLASTRIETKTLTATVNPGPGQVLIAQQATVSITAGPPSPITSTVTASPLTVLADGVAFTTVTVTVRDATGNLIPGATVSLGATGSANTFVQPAITDASGVTTGTLASTRAEAKSVIATVNPGPGQVVLAQQPTVTFVPGPPSAATSTFTASPLSVVADGVAQSALTAVVRDAQGNPIPGLTVQLAATGTANTLTQPATTDASGTATGTLASTKAEAKTATATVSPGPGQVVLTQHPVITFVPGPPSATLSTVTANPLTVVANGVATTLVTVVLQDAQGNLIPSMAVSLSATGSANTFVQPNPTDASGTTQGTLASTKAEVKTITATANPGPSQVVLAQTPNVTFIPGPISATVSTVAATPTQLPADNVATTTVTVALKDANGNPIPGGQVTLSSTGRFNTFVQPTPSAADGVTTGTLASGQAEVKTITATANPGAVVLAQKPAVTFLSGPPVPVPGSGCTQASSMALDPATGRVAVAYYQGSSLLFAQCTANCVTTPVWSAPQTVDTNVIACPETDSAVSLQFVAPGQPAVVYKNGSANLARYAVRDTGGVWRASTIEATGANVVGSLSLVLVGPGKVPAAAYHVHITDTQRLARYAVCTAGCTTGTGVAWNRQTVDATGNAGHYLTLTVDPVSQLPRMAYVDDAAFGGLASALRYATCADASAANTCATGRGNWSIGLIDAVFGVQTGYWSSLEIGVAGPKISYQDSTNGRLEMASCTANCGTGAAASWTTTVVDAGPNTGLYTVLRVDELGQAHIAYYDTVNKRVRYAVQSGNTNTFTVVTVQSSIATGQPSMLLSPPGTNFAYANGNAGLIFYPSSLF